MSEKDQYLNQISRIIASPVLHNSESLCKLLQYLATHALGHPNTPLKEYQLATGLFGRRSDFDPHSDSTIRVQAGRLRLKLAEYYGSDGSQDPILVELPKGTYILSFHHRQPAVPQASPALVSNRSGSTRDARPSSWMIATAATSFLLLLAVASIGMIVTSRQASSTARAGNSESPPPAFQSFWKPFISKPEEPWLIFSNAAFVGRPETGMRYYSAERDSQESIWDHYTGVGEVLAVHSLDNVLNRF